MTVWHRNMLPCNWVLMVRAVKRLSVGLNGTLMFVPKVFIGFLAKKPTRSFGRRGRQSPWSESVFAKEVRALKSSTMPHILLNELWTALRNKALYLKINTHQHAQVINQMLASCGTTMRLVESERNPNRYYLSIAGSVPTDAAARVVLRTALLTQVIFCRSATKPALPTGKSLFSRM